MPHILVVDDEPEVLSTISEGLALEDISVDTAQNGRDGLHLVFDRSKKYDLIVSDFMMPIMDGLTLYKKTRFKKIPFILITAYIDDLKNHQQLQQDDLIIIDKPLNIGDLADAIKSHSKPK